MKSINKRSQKKGPLDDKVIISSEYFQNDRPSYICSICNQTLVRLTDAGMNNQEPEIKGAFKELQKKGLKITNYKESVP